MVKTRKVSYGKKIYAEGTHIIMNQLQKINNTDLTWFGRQLQPTSTRATIRFYFCHVAHQLQVL